MKAKMIALVLLCSFLCTGCFNYIDINNVIFVISLLIDVNEEGAPIIIVEAFHSFRSNQTNAERGNRIFYEAEGETIFDAVRQLNSFSSYKINYTQNKAIIFTERAAEHGLKEFLDFLQRDQELLLRSYILVLKGNDYKTFMKAVLRENDYLGIYLYEALQNPATAGRRARGRFNTYLNNRLKGKKVDVLTAIMHEINMEENKVKIVGVAVMQEDKLVGILDEQQVRAYHFLMDTLEGGLLTIPHPSYPERKVVLEILKSNTKTFLEMKKNGIYLRKSIDIRTTFAEAQESIILNQDNLEKLKQEAALLVEEECKALFELYKGKGIDLFDIQDMFEAKYPQIDLSNVIDATYLEVDVKVKIEGSSDILNYQ